MIHSYPWYIADWRQSEAVAGMTLEQKGLYRELLDQCWLEGSLPPTEELLIKLIRVSRAEWRRSWPSVCPQFVERDGRLWNAKVDEKRGELQRWHENRRESGKKGAKARWDGSGNGSAMAQPIAPHKLASWPSSTTSSTTSSSIQDSLLDSSVLSLGDSAIEKASQEIHSRHPQRRRDCSVQIVKKKLQAILRHKHITNGHSGEYLEIVNCNHAAACASSDWQKEGGEYAKSLTNWLAPTIERYDCRTEDFRPQQPRLVI